MRGQAYSEFTQHYPRPGWVEHDAEEIWAREHRAASPKRSRAPASRPGNRGHRHHEPARDERRCGIARRARPSRAPSSGRTGARPAICDELKARGLEELFRRKTGLVVDAYFSGTKIRWLLDNTEGLRGRAAARRDSLRDDRLVARLEADGRARTRHGLLQRLAHAALQHHTTSRWDEELLAILDVPRGGPAGGRALRRTSTATRTRPRSSARRPRRGNRGRPAGGALRSGVLRRGPGEEHLRHGLVPPAEHGPRGRREPRRTC